MEKRVFDIEKMLRRIEAAVRPYPKAALFALAEEGHASAFEQVVACIISVRTRDEVTLPTARALLSKARTAAAVSRLTPGEIDGAIRACTFHEPKSRQIHELARRIVEEHGGRLPCEEEALLALRGVGPKCASLVLGIACGEPRISVDVHVWRVTYRWGVTTARTPERAVPALEEAIPRRRWIDLNRLLVPFGKHICTGRRPHCSTCPVLEYCRQVGVTSPR